MAYPISFRAKSIDELNMETIAEYLAVKNPELPEPKKSDVIRYALYVAAREIAEEHMAELIKNHPAPK